MRWSSMRYTENPSGGATRKSASMLIRYSNRLISVPNPASLFQRFTEEAGYGQKEAGRDLCPCLDGRADNGEPAARARSCREATRLEGRRGVQGSGCQRQEGARA